MKSSIFNLFFLGPMAATDVLSEANKNLKTSLPSTSVKVVNIKGREKPPKTVPP